MHELWIASNSIATAMLENMVFHGLQTNERYLHHFFSHRLQVQHPRLMDLVGNTSSMRLHPEWPTYKEATGIDCGRYQEVNGRYQAQDVGRKGGFVDFALGEYASPCVGIEFKQILGWQAEGIVFDYMKLLDGRNPFAAVVQITVMIRPNGLSSGGRRRSFHNSMNNAYVEAIGRLAQNPSSTSPVNRMRRLIVTELAPTERRHWYNDANTEFVEVPSLPSCPPGLELPIC